MNESFDSKVLQYCICILATVKMVCWMGAEPTDWFALVADGYIVTVQGIV